MLAARDQENLVHGQQAAAAAKPLNRGNKYVPPKTPGAKVPKTPFNGRQHDENAIGGLGAGKTALLGREKGINGPKTGGKQGGGLGRNAFETPMGPRTRAPLGFKTTNAKAKGFQTPGPAIPEHGSNKLQGKDQLHTSARKPKPRIAPKETVKRDLLGASEDEERDIEYMPPRAKEMSDHPDDFPPDADFSILENLHKSNDWLAGSGDPLGHDGMTDLQRKLKREDEERAENQKAEYDLLARQISNMDFPGVQSILAEYHPEGLRKASDPDTKPAGKGPQTQNGLSKSELKRAAIALSSHTGIRKPALISKATAPSKNAIRSKKPLGIKNPSINRPDAATIASKSTIGYANGRATSGSIINSRQKPVSSSAAATSSRDSNTTQISKQRKPGLETFRQMIQHQSWDEDSDIDDKIVAPTLSELLRDDEAKADFELHW